MDPLYETKKRLKIARKISRQFRNIARCVLLGGSLGYGQNFSITSKSDIDLVVVCDKNKLKFLLHTPFLKDEINREVCSLFEKRKLNLIWIKKIELGIEVNIFIYETVSYKDFCLSEKEIIGFSKTPKESKKITKFFFDGSCTKIDINSWELFNGQCFIRPGSFNGRYCGGPNKTDFLYSSIPIVGKSFFKEISKKFWKFAIKKLIEEHGPHVNLKKHNLLNTHFTYVTSPHRIPPKIIKRIELRTLKEIRLKIKKKVFRPSV